jgi:hypothetical protein
MAFLIATKLVSRVNPKLIVSEYGRTWLDDEAFFDYYRQLVGDTYTSADRKFFLRSILSVVDGLPGDTAECGVYRGASSWLICEHFRNTDKTHHLFDSFQGLSAPVTADGGYWHEGDMEAGEALVLNTLSPYKVASHKGWIPDRFVEVRDKSFCFVHIDVDLYQPTSDSLHFSILAWCLGGSFCATITVSQRVREPSRHSMNTWRTSWRRLSTFRPAKA